jgi:hypothetical protein
MQILVFIFISVFFFSCTNQFSYKENDWKLVSESLEENPKKLFADMNRTVCKNSRCESWTKMDFDRDTFIPFSSEKLKRQGVLIARRIDSKVMINCLTQEVTISSYQVYNQDGELLDSKWLRKPEVQTAKVGTLEGDLLKFICK